jgi:hypothetical protein
MVNIETKLSSANSKMGEAVMGLLKMAVFLILSRSLDRSLIPQIITTIKNKRQ